MGRNRTPTELLELRGAFRKNPQRRRDIGAKSDQQLGPPPPHLTPAEAACWRELERNLPSGILTSAERWTVETVSRLMSRLRADWLTGAELGQLTAGMAKLGMAPATRAGLPQAQSAATSAFDEFLT